MESKDFEYNQELLDDIKANRNGLHTMLNTIAEFRNKVDTLLPDKVDFRSRWMLPERMKTITEIVKTELAVRKQIDDSLKTEYEMRKKKESKDNADEGDKIKYFAGMIEKLEGINDLKMTN